MTKSEKYKILFLKKWVCTILAIGVYTYSLSQTGQINIPRVDLMPNLPSPYLMRDWKKVASQYDSMIFSLSATGQYLPLMKLKSAGVNYSSLQPIQLDSYVGSANHGLDAESINIIPSIVGASLNGIDKSNQVGTNWVIKVKDFFNKANGQNVYLNGSSSVSGSDWWYDMMPNVFFYQLYSQYPSTLDFDTQFTTIADRWLGAVQKMGGSTIPWTVPQMNYTAFNLATMFPFNNGFTEPESAGTIAWLLYHAYNKTGNKKYLDGAQQAMTFLSNLNSNPAYEIQLPYGTLIAAKMNAELGTRYHTEKMVNWSFTQSAQRNWGTIVGNWGGADVSGLVGEIDNPATGYAFAMNGFQQAAALVPMVKYDKRFARAIAKWTLNLANASRFFYSKYLPSTSQDDFAWSSTNDPNSLIGYEAIKQMSLSGGIPLYGTGDAKRNGWAATNLGIYGSSHVGYLAAIVDKTTVDGILLLDINKTDFFGQNGFPSFLTYNPYGTTKQITLALDTQSFDIYNTISETVIKTNVTGNVLLDIQPNEAMLLVYVPTGSTFTAKDGKLYVGSTIVDYHYGYNFNGKLRIRSLGAKDPVVQFNQQEKLYSSIENKTAPVSFNWYANGSLIATSADSVLNWTVPSVAGSVNLVLKVTSGTMTVKDSLQFQVVAHIAVPPNVAGITKDSLWYSTGKTATLICHASNLDKTKLQYTWSTSSGTILDQKDSLIHWRAPVTEGIFQISCLVTNLDALTASTSQAILVKSKSQGSTPPIAYYPFDSDTKDYSGNGRNAILQGAQPTVDAIGQPNKAYLFTTGSDIIYVNNDAGLNFQNQITASFWVQLNTSAQESYVLSHGSYEQRWKVSIIANNKLRWTVKTNNSTTDLDSSVPLLLNTFYHVAVVYTGYSMELYINGVLDTFIPDSGLINIATKEITFGRKDISITSYSFHGTLDEVRLYDKALAPNEIATLKNTWYVAPITALEDSIFDDITMYPNPSTGTVTINGMKLQVNNIRVLDVTGREIESHFSYIGIGKQIQVEFSPSNSGILILRIETQNKTIYKKLVVH